MTATSTKINHARRRTGAWILQGLVAIAFFAAGGAKLAGAAYMVQLFDQIGVGQWFRYATGFVEVIGALALIYPGLASIGGLWLGGTMVFAVLTHLFVLHTSFVPAIVLGLLNALIIYLRRDELASLLRAAMKRFDACSCERSLLAGTHTRMKVRRHAMLEGNAQDSDKRLYLDDLFVGQRFTSRTHVIDEAQIKAFARQFDPSLSTRMKTAQSK